MAKKKYFKLGPAASNFYDVNSGVSIVPGQVVEVTAEQENYVPVDSAIKHRHIVEATEEEFLAQNQSAEEVEEDEDNTEDEETEFDVNKATKAEIIAEILEYEGHEYTEANLKGLNKDELIEVYKEITEED